MSDRLKIYRVVIVVLLCASIVFSVGCGIKAGEDRVATPVDTPTQLPQSPLNKSSDNATARFASEPVEAPQPGTEGSFVDELHAWVIGELQLKNSNDLKRSRGLVFTTDGGKTWDGLLPSPESKALDWLPYYYWQIRFISPTRGWLTGNDSTWQTDDGGLTWRRIFSASFDELQFRDEQHGWMNIADASGQQTYVTEDGGQTWQLCGSKRDYSNQVPRQDSYFLSPQVGWALTSKADKKDPRITVKGVAKSIDGGCTWNQVWINRDPDARYNDIYFLNDHEGWLAGEATLLHSSDGGKSWLEIPRPTSETNVFQVYFVNSKEGWIISGYPFMPPADTGMYRTFDAGKTWKQLSEKEIIDGFNEHRKRVEVPGDWKAGKLLQLLHASKDNNRNK